MVMDLANGIGDLPSRHKLPKVEVYLAIHETPCTRRIIKMSLPSILTSLESKIVG